MRTATLPGLVAFLWLTAHAVSAQYLVRLDFQQMEPYLGKRLVTRVVEASTGDEVGRKTIESIPADDFTFDLYCLFLDKSYIVYYWIDVNGSGDYDAPPMDHTWQLTMTDIDQNTQLNFTPNKNYVDAGLPDPFPYSQYDATWGGRWQNLTFGSTDSIEAGMRITCDSFSGFFTTKGVFGNPATLLFDTAGAITPGGEGLPDTLSFGIDPPWTGQVQVVDGEINASLGFMGATLEFIGTLGAKQILCFYEVYFGGNFIAAGYFYLRELQIHSSAPDLSIELQANAEVSCYDASDGFLQTGGEGGTPGYSYLWSTGDTTSLLAAVPGGDYALTMTDVDGCIATATYSVSEPAPIIILPVAIDFPCPDSCNEMILIEVGGGIPPLTFTWSNGSTTQNLEGLCEGTYVVTVTDANGCTDVLPIDVFSVPPFNTVVIQIIDETGGKANGSIEIDISGGNSPYTHRWTKDGVFYSGEEDIFNLSAGTYELTTEDNFGCLHVSGPYIIHNLVSVPEIHTCFSLYPNPASDKLFIEADDLVKVEIISVDGKVLMQHTWSRFHEMNMHDLARGHYMARIMDDHGASMIPVMLK